MVCSGNSSKSGDSDVTGGLEVAGGGVMWSDELIDDSGTESSLVFR